MFCVCVCVSFVEQWGHYAYAPARAFRVALRVTPVTESLPDAFLERRGIPRLLKSDAQIVFLGFAVPHVIVPRSAALPGVKWKVTRWRCEQNREIASIASKCAIRAGFSIGTTLCTRSASQYLNIRKVDSIYYMQSCDRAIVRKPNFWSPFRHWQFQKHER